MGSRDSGEVKSLAEKSKWGGECGTQKDEVGPISKWPEVVRKGARNSEKKLGIQENHEREP